MKKSLNKKGAIYRKRYTDELIKQMELFVKDCIGKTDEEIMELYKWYESNWHKFANQMNMRHKAAEGMMVIGFTDAFESSMRFAYRELPALKANAPKADYLHYKRVFDMFRYRNKVQQWLYNIEKRIDQWLEGFKKTKK